MDVLLIGSRGRDHALAIELKKDPRVENIFCIPGNGGLAGIATCFKIDIFNFKAILEFLDANPNIGLTIVSPDELLAQGLVDLLNTKGHRAFGCSAPAARVESSKEFANGLCAKYNIPSPKYIVFDDYTKAKKYLKMQKFPLVVKTEGRTGGKGIMFCHNMREAENALYDIMVAKLFGASGDKIVIEEFVKGEIVNMMAFTDGKTIVPLPAVESYKRVFDGNLGMSTAGMGASMPASYCTSEVQKDIYENILVPTMNALNAENSTYKGVIGFNIVISENGAKVVDFVSRICDTEGQVILPLIETPLLDIFNAIIDEKLAEIDVKVKHSACVCIVATSGGYPLEYTKNIKINLPTEIAENVYIFHSGTKLTDGELRTAGGRVLGVTSFGDNKEQCAKDAYDVMAKISYDGMHYRKDIARAKA